MTPCRLNQSIAALLLFLFAEATIIAADGPPRGDLAGFERVITPLFRAHCLACHRGAEAEAGLDLTAISGDLIGGPDAQKWREIVDRLNLGDMPPPKRPRPTATELQAGIDWITKELKQAALAAQSRGGRAVLRRLNQAEYRNTVRDLIGLPIDAAQYLPTDTPGHGFDTVGGDLTVSPLHIENYLEASERILDLAIVAEQRPLKRHFRLEYLGSAEAGLQADPRSKGKSGEIERRSPDVAPGRFQGKNSIFNFDGKTFYKELETVGPPPTLHHDFVDLTAEPPKRYLRHADVLLAGSTGGKPEIEGQSTLKFRLFNYDPGVYRIRLKAAAHAPANWDGALPSLRITLEPEKRLLKLLELTTAVQEFECLVYCESIPTYQSRYNQRSWGLTLSFPTSVMLPAAEAERFTAESAQRTGGGRGMVRVPVGVHLESIEVEGPFLGEQWPPAYHRRILFDSPRSAEEPAYAREVLERFITRAYRRPAVAAEVERFFRLFEVRRAAGGSFSEAIRVPLAAVLASPRFLYILESGAEDRPQRLDAFELAARLSYFLWSAPPDAELLRLAGSGELGKDGVLIGQTHRLLDNPRSFEFVRNFTGQWLKLRKLADFQVDRVLYPRFDAAAKAGMETETQEFFAEILRRNLSVLNFLDSDWTMLNQSLAHYYGIPGVLGPEFRRVPLLPEHHRGGLLTQASILTLTANGIRTLPVQRGVFVLEEILNDPPPPPPPNAGQLEDTVPESDQLSVKKRLELHRRSATCAACHDKIDPYGFALENFDPIGQWRTFERLLVEEQKKDKDGQVINVPRIVPGDAVETAARLPGGQSYREIGDFKQLLVAEKSRFVDALSHKLLTYALGRPVTFADELLVASLRERCTEAEYRIRPLIEGIVLSEAFRQK